MFPKVSIIIPTYNRAHLIGETLDSILAQTYTNWECIIVDDGSTDNMDAVVESYLRKDQRFQYHHRPKNRKKGANTCRNYGFELSKGDYIQWLDSDDLISRNKLEKQISILNLCSPLDIVFGKWKRFKEDIDNAVDINKKTFYKSYESGYVFMEALGEYKTFMASHSYLVSRDIISKSGLWNPYLLSNQDGEFFNRILLNCGRVIFCENVTSYYRMNCNISVSSYSSIDKIISVINSWILIENRMILQYDLSKFKYIENAKNRVFIDLNKSDFSYLKYNYQDFFNIQLVSEKEYFRKKRLYKRALRKLNKKLERWFPMFA
ncbi:glycosyltransferase family 2 protein [Aequorivita echinoideorum]|uniref:Glycosyltransferase family 2 protein n=1 Tax=Aequorivita echinoideorum TaxID=1549647 RepID=A0ABS5S5F1_9FLAO|nr:glycosyltransferase family 2 protein [Aequorivita echinoideorum]MBT0608446.1 glycosyltransferase family 2 protein [Aequorivita echinoideorum]